jgi:UDP-N-acetylmuramate--alanine ligase
MNHKNHSSDIFFIGIGGIGMSALARYFKSQGKNVSGYDLTPSPLTEQLIREGMTVFYDDDSTKLPDNIDLAIYTPAVPDDLGLFETLAQRNIPVKKRAAVLARIAESHQTIAIAGTHGKTTTTAILAHIFYLSKFGCTAFVGGIVSNYASNFLSTENTEFHRDSIHNSQLTTHNSHVIAGLTRNSTLNSPLSTPIILEADEYDRSLLHLKPTVAAINSMDSDHLDIYETQEALIETYNLFANQIDKRGFLVVKKGLEKYIDAAIETFTVSIEDRRAHYHSDNIRIVDGYYHFDLHTPQGMIEDVVYGGGGFVNIANAVTAAAIALQYGIDADTVKAALQSFAGVLRRFQFRIRHEKMVLIDDYAHHPEEIRMMLQSVRDLYPDKKITAVFQPHLYTRTRDFVAGFAETLSLADELLLLDIYPARELPIEGVNSAAILSKMAKKNGKLVNKQNLIKELINVKPQVVVMLGAGDIDRLVAPVEEALLAMI